MARELEFFFDYGSPFSYLADSQLKGLAERTGARVIYRPMLLGGVFKETGNSSPIAIEAKRKYSNIDLARWAKHYGVAALHNAHFPINTIRLMRGAIAAEHLGVFPAYHRAIYDAFWRDGLNLGDAAVVREVLQRAGLDAERIAAASEEPAVKDALRVSTETAVARGAFGAPTFFVGDQMFWGNDRLMFVEQALSALS
ncbi:MAG TPA: 2-hydroxychromene-2-carboxylate isomerase [Candidatus Binataceae bacterium]|jgi:2-hydroxychromene-2-carboxylate isomerase|nr:2-hydroxychromene-2-carboxylate isomerase [Candidatus Binataceae bacterium]